MLGAGEIDAFLAVLKVRGTRSSCNAPRWCYTYAADARKAAGLEALRKQTQVTGRI